MVSHPSVSTPPSSHPIAPAVPGSVADGRKEQGALPSTRRQQRGGRQEGSALQRRVEAPSAVDGFGSRRLSALPAENVPTQRAAEAQIRRLVLLIEGSWGHRGGGTVTQRQLPEPSTGLLHPKPPFILLPLTETDRG